MRPEQLDLITTVSTPAVSPDGSRVVVAATHASFANDGYPSQLWEVDPSGSQSPRRLTRGTRDGSPAFSPDGRWLAFTREGDKGKTQLAVLDARGGEARLLTDRPLGVGEFVWSPDSRSIAFVARVPEDGRYGTTEGVSGGQEDPRRITGFKYRINGPGFIGDKPTVIHLVELPDADEEPWIEPKGRAAAPTEPVNEPDAAPPSGVVGGRKGYPSARMLTSPDRDAHAPRFSPDGRWVYFVAALHDTADSDLRSMLHRVPVTALRGEGVQLVAGDPAGPLSWDGCTFSGDGSQCYALVGDVGETGIEFVATNEELRTIPADALAADELDAAALEWRILNDPQTDTLTGLVPGAGGSALLLSASRGAVELHRVRPDGTREVVHGGQLRVTGAVEAMSTTGEAAGPIAVAFTGPETPGDVAILRDDTVTTVTDFNARLREQAPVIPAQELVVDNEGSPVHGWVLVPEGDGPHPTLLMIHGGPYADYGWGWFDEAQVFAGAGYGVVMCNPRGSAGYGSAHGTAIQGAMGTVDFADVIAFLEGALATHPTLDPARTGVMGGSYGGYLTAWTIAHDHRWAGAIVERGYLDPLSFVGSSDIGWFFTEGYTGTDPEQILRQSPFAVVDKVATPTLVIHSEEDWRCPVEQAQRYYVALKRNGVEAEFLLFPGENHELSRSGTPWHRRQRFEAILDWWSRHLPLDR